MNRWPIAAVKDYAASASLSPQERISYATALFIYGGQLAYEAFPWLGADGELYPVNQLFGIQNSLPNFMQFQPKGN